MPIINSIGTRNWVNFLDLWADKKITLHECPTCIIEAANMIPDVLPRGRSWKAVVSLEASYYCHKCEAGCVYNTAINELDIGEESVVGPVKVCDKCGNPVSLEDNEDYFAFIIDAD